MQQKTFEVVVWLICLTLASIGFGVWMGSVGAFLFIYFGTLTFAQYQTLR